MRGMGVTRRIGKRIAAIVLAVSMVMSADYVPALADEYDTVTEVEIGAEEESETSEADETNAVPVDEEIDETIIFSDPEVSGVYVDEISLSDGTMVVNGETVPVITVEPAEGTDKRVYVDVPSNLSNYTFMWPIDGSFNQKSQGYKFYGRDNSENHIGLDMSNADGKTLRAVTDGVVVAVYKGCKNRNGLSTGVSCSSKGCNPTVGFQDGAWCNYGFGNGIVVYNKEMGIGWSFAHMQSIDSSIKSGNEIKQGDPLGVAGSSGHSKGPHCHFDIGVMDAKIDFNRRYPQGEVYKNFDPTNLNWYDGTHTCQLVMDNPYSDAGKCSICHRYMDEKVTDVTDSSNNGVYVTNATNISGVYIREAPYEEANWMMMTSPRGVKMEVFGEVVNGWGNHWYKVRISGVEGYVYAPRLTREETYQFQEMLSNRFDISQFIASPGNGVTLTGRLAASVPIKRIEGQIINASGTVIYSCVGFDANGNESASVDQADLSETVESSEIADPETGIISGIISGITKTIYSYVFSGSNLEKKLMAKCRTLGVGTYKYRIRVTYSKPVNGSTQSVTDTSAFTIANSIASNPTASSPTIRVKKSYDGGIQFQITQTTSGGTLYYSTDSGRSYMHTTAKSVLVDVYSSTTIYAYTNTTSNRVSRNVTIVQADPPTIDTQTTANGTIVKISHYADVVIHYKINDGPYQTYWNSFTVTNNCRITAYVGRNGYYASNPVTVEVTAKEPDTPVIRKLCAEDIAAGDALTLCWNEDSNAQGYRLTILKDNECWFTAGTYKTQYSVNTDGPGVYTAYVSAYNQVGYSGVSNQITVTAHGPSTVTFKDYDGRVLSEQSVVYGRNAVKPSIPSRRGYTFSGWSGSFSRVIEDTTVTAEYEINIYRVKFYNPDETLIGYQDITFDESIDSAAMEALVSTENGGRRFSAWDIFYVKEEDSYRDLAHIDSDMSLRAVTTWTNENLPVFIDNVSAVISYGATSGLFDGYHVSCDVSTTETKDQKIKLIVALYSDAGNGVYKMTNVKVDTIHFDAGTSNLSWSGDVICDGSRKSDRVEISAVAIEGSDRTGGLIAESKTCAISESASVFWSDWMTAEELTAKGYAVGGEDVDSKVQYSSRTNTKHDISSSSSTAPEGYTNEGLRIPYIGVAGNWSDWQETQVYKSSSRDVESKQDLVSSGYYEYRYGCTTNGSNRHFCKNLALTYYLGTTYYDSFTAWSTTRYSANGGTNPVCSYTNHDHRFVLYYNGSAAHWNDYLIGGKHYYWENSRYVDTSYYRTLYRYRDYTYTYYYYKWIYGDWSAWTDDVIVDESTSLDFEVRTQTLYRYKIYDASKLTTDTSGTVRSISGTLSSVLAGKKASILVYKSKNNDPTESQLQYVGQTSIGSNGEYSYTYITREEPGDVKSDFVIAMIVEGSNNLVTIGQIRYDRGSYKVSFEGPNGVISEQTIAEGDSAVAPEAPEVDGYTFAGWSRSFTNITDNIIVNATYKPNSYCIAFTDYVNHSCTLVRADGGSNITIPEALTNLTAEGYTFAGWDIPEDQIITEDMVIEAKWTPVTYTVKFIDANENVISTQSVEYGKSAEIPTVPAVGEGYVCLGWDETNEWWKVTSDMDVRPIVVYESNAAAPVSNKEMVERGLADELVLESEEGATIYYTTDGSAPEDPTSPESSTYKYEGPIAVTDGMLICAVAVKDGMGESPVSVVNIEAEDEYSTDVNYGEIVTAATRNVTVKTGDVVTLTFGLNSDVALAASMLLIDFDPTKFCVIYDGDTGGFEVAADKLTVGNGLLFVDPYREGLGATLHWVGDGATKGTGNLFKLNLYACGDGTYPITINYSTAQTFGKEGAPVNLFSALDVQGTVNGDTIKFATTTEDGEEESGIKIDEIPEQVYTGSAIKPEIKMYDNGIRLIENVDYTVKYKNNVKVNDATDASTAPTVQIKGKGNYSDNFTVTFAIVEANIAASDFTAPAKVELKYTGKKQTVNVTLKKGKTTLKAGTDYTLQITDSDGAPATPKAEGDYIITLTGKGNYTGTREIPLRIIKGTSIAKAKISITDRNYTGEPLLPPPNVYVNKVLLTEDVDYTVRYENNVNAGKGTVIIEGIGRYYGTAKATFKILGVSVANVTVSGLTDMTYTGKEIRQNLTLTYDGETLVADRDYTLVYRNNKTVGKATVTVTGNGGFSGTKSYTFNITKGHINDSESFVVKYFDAAGNRLEGDDLQVAFAKGGSAISATVTDTKNGYALRKGVDYKIKLANYTTVSGTKKASITITGIGNYDKSVKKSYAVVAQDISLLRIEVPDVAYSKRTGKYASTPAVYDLNGKKLEAGTDYSKTVVYTYVEETIVGSVTRAAGDCVGKRDIIPAGTKLQVTVSGIKGYTGSVSAIYEVKQFAIGSASIVTKSKLYTGEAVTLDPAQDDIKVIHNGHSLVYGTDYEIVAYSNNVNKGKATVVIKGKGNYGGTVKVNFTIGSRKILWWII